MNFINIGLFVYGIVQWMIIQKGNIKKLNKDSFFGMYIVFIIVPPILSCLFSVFYKMWTNFDIFNEETENKKNTSETSNRTNIEETKT